MYLSKRKNGFWYLYYQDHNGNIKAKTTKQKKKSEAVKFLRTFETREPKADIYFSDFKKIYLRHSASIHAYKTGKDIKTTLNFFTDFIGSIKINKISTALINEYLRTRLKKSTYTASKDLRYLRAMFNYAVANDYLVINPTAKIKNIKTPERQPLFLSKSDFKKLCKQIYDEKLIDFLDLVIFSTYTGLRQSEIINLTWNQIDLTRDILILDNSSHITKSKKVRTIPLSRKAKAVLKRRSILNHYVFTNESKEKYKNDFVTKRFKKFVIAAELNNKFKFHSLRHTFASWLVQRDVPIQKVSKLLGHSDLSTTQIYAHLTVNDLQKSVGVI